MSSTSTQQVRPVIECFCQILSLYGFSPITPEIFRLAKFNHNEAVRFNELVNMIKSNLFTYGYTYENFLLLDNKMEKGSQQLLICLGWLIYQIKLIEKSMEICLNSDSIFDYDDTSSLYKIDKIEHIKYSSQEKDLPGQVKQAMRLNSKLRFGLRRLHGLVIENANLQHQIHDSHNMSSLEAHLCQHPHLLSHYMIELENEHQKLNLFNFWNQHEDIFWKWMESVLDQTTTTTIEQDENEDKYKPLRQVDCQRLEIEKQKFNAAIDTLDNTLVRLKQLCLINNNDPLIEHDISSIVASIDTKVSILFNQLLTTNSLLSIKSNSNQSFFLHKPYRLVYSKKSDSNNNNNNNHFIKPINFEDETIHLNTLQKNIDQNIEKQKTILETISNQFQNVMIV
ncbi:unnamed protein product [Rotaria sordida]|uniref:Tubulin epsilon and delta complex protein 1 domain-containing protein n=1 Tax=Rotaria sordida TaxID=392033 RepID=A0A814GCA4_9BILA|nr:unnamed protein product [Rotaria sordida]CAF1071571.1 unnamed protein product [Rotaria sordida]